MKNLEKDIKSHKKIIAVYGLGNVGGSIAASWLRVGAKVIGVDVSKKLLEDIQKGRSHKKEPFVSEVFSNALKKNNFELTNDGVYASKVSDIKIIVVPVAITKKKTDLSKVIAVAKTISRGLKKNDVVILSPSVPPGTTEKILLPILEKGSALKGEKDFLLIYNPERIFEGRAIQDIEENYPAIIAGLGKHSARYGSNLLKIISKKGVIVMSNLSTAEAEKLFEGVYRDVNIALANQLAEFCSKTGINFWEARKAANSQPFCHLHYPGTGVGGLCIPVYPRIIIESSKYVQVSSQIIETGRDINDGMPKKCALESIKFFKKFRKNSKISKIAILGLGFRGEVTDKRLSPTYDLIKEFQKLKPKIFVHDPYILDDDELPSSVKLTNKLQDVIKNADLIVVSTDHKKYAILSESSFNLAKQPAIIFDGRNILNKSKFTNAKIKTIGI